MKLCGENDMLRDANSDLVEELEAKKSQVCPMCCSVGVHTLKKRGVISPRLIPLSGRITHTEGMDW